MEASAVPQTQKRLYRNNTAGWLGVVVLDHDGKPVGESIEPFGTVWLSDAEAILTARAPRRPEDNPFEEQVFVGVNSETQAREDFVMRPLTLETTSERYVPTERYVPVLVDAPPDAAPPVAQTAATAETQAPAPATASAGTPVPPPPPAAAPQGRPTPAARTEPDEPESWVTPPEAPGRILPGTLDGGDGPPPEVVAAAAPDPTNAPTEAGRYVPSVNAQAAPQTPGSEEHAAAVDPRIGEETGAARPPAQPQAEGEYAQAEEVGSPDAPRRSNDESLIGE
jgi:hypothetical protein